MIVPEVADAVDAVELDGDASASDTQKRLKTGEPEIAREARYAAQLLPALEASGIPAAPPVREFIEIFPDKVPPPPIVESGMRSTSHLVPNTAPHDSGHFRAT
ncbi:hypothetical protein PC129_g22582 [Phytophthora cactorum]|uniref:Uncharacterized protein n=1 Tax=Phytophthora cactorum TaxID=29920 RepID=A0A8T1AKG8_9STRA|nr:hypothetical protein Pcac1_g8861 [Phytophthora cactorum]KAG2795189.1 hypothetical protein PC111_g22256 [Phytophthora cactorum]KAG2795522.1 hypothetical protein PC112_g22604 [Phytophthora cactorum]KAG2821466.1 hypothetical protein PC113_g22473 [Phytophthora cactorum]KAG2873815.1 hypothetical protein PC114_g25648 [Phytophthora cactorum]